jgi:hypothetical protein
MWSCGLLGQASDQSKSGWFSDNPHYDEKDAAILFYDKVKHPWSVSKFAYQAEELVTCTTQNHEKKGNTVKVFGLKVNIIIIIIPPYSFFLLI